jgi:hypothetical protein
MWIFKYFTCLVQSHVFTEVTWRDLPYKYCLRCGKFEERDITANCHALLYGQVEGDVALLR